MSRELTDKHTAEPWTFDGAVIMNTRREVVVFPDRHHRNGDLMRIAQCVNACAGIGDPAAALKLAREVARLSGGGPVTIEGAPSTTNQLNNALAGLCNALAALNGSAA